MSLKREDVSAIITGFEGKELDAHYLAFFECFNRQHYFEAHEVLEHIWLPQRKAANGLFYKGLIQLSGAFVHMQKNRPGPAAALLKLAQSNLRQYGPSHERLDVEGVLEEIHEWLRELESNGGNPLTFCAPMLALEPEKRSKESIGSQPK